MPRTETQPETSKSETTAKFCLTGDDLALAGMGLAHLLNWWQTQPRSPFKTESVARARDLKAKLSAIGDHAYPYERPIDGGAYPDHGGEAIMRLDLRVVAKTRRAAARGEAVS